MHVEARMFRFRKPSRDLGMLVGGVVVSDQMNRQTGGNFAVDGLEEGEPLLVPMAFGDPADQLAVEEFKAANNVSVPCRM